MQLAEARERLKEAEKEEAELTQQDKDLKAEDRLIKEKRVSGLSLTSSCEEAHDDNARMLSRGARTQSWPHVSSFRRTSSSSVRAFRVYPS